jgi:hypothetical protein
MLQADIFGPDVFVAATGAKTTVNSCATILGTIEVTAKGGFPPYQIYRNDTLTSYVINYEEDTLIVDGLIPGVNHIRVVDACGTGFDLYPSIDQLTNYLSVFAYANFPANATGDNICMGDSIQLVAQPSSGAGSYTYVWEWIYQGETIGGSEGISNPNAA